MGALDEEAIRRVYVRLGSALKEMPFDVSPAEAGMCMFSALAEEMKGVDPYAALKKKANALALNAYGRAKQTVMTAPDPLEMAIEFACAGNIIDYGVYPPDFDVEGEIERIVSRLNEQSSAERAEFFKYEAFKDQLPHVDRMMVIGDNAGEVLFDRILLETMVATYPDITMYYATRGYPVLNDCVIEDALECGIDGVATVVSSGVASPGLVLNQASGEFLELLHTCDFILSKGQGNYESLSNENIPAFYALMAKCEAVANDAQCPIGTLILQPSRIWNWH